MPECDELYAQLRPRWEQLPAPLQAGRAYHLGIHAAHPPMTLLAALRAAAHAHGGACPPTLLLWRLSQMLKHVPTLAASPPAGRCHVLQACCQ